MANTGSPGRTGTSSLSAAAGEPYWSPVFPYFIFREAHPGGSVAEWNGGAWDATHQSDLDDCIGAIAIPQVWEIMTHDKPDVLWWDMPIGLNGERAEKSIPLLRLKLTIIHNNHWAGVHPSACHPEIPMRPRRGGSCVWVSKSAESPTSYVFW